MGGKRYGLLGRKLGHSFSAPIHAELGCADYELIELEPEELGPFLRSEDIGGLNVTIPYKRDVMDFLDEISPRAQAIGSVNTVVCRDGRLIGHNTDADGFLFMVKRLGVDFTGKKVVIFGSGGASLMVRAMARELGASEAVVVSRSGEDNYGNLDRHRDAAVLVNATPLGTYPNTEGYAADPGDFPECEAVFDLVYNPGRTAFLQLAEKAGIPFSNGLPMLVAQAKAAEELFFDKKINDGEIGRILRRLTVETRNIVLIGMPGSGKTTVGAALAELTGREAIDVDTEIASGAGRGIPEIFASDGEEGFRALEREYTAKYGAQSGKIIMTGGGVVKDARNYPSLHQNGRIYHIERDTALLARFGRPLSENADLGRMYRERLPLYEAFRDAAADNNGAPRQTAAAIWRDFCENSCD